MKYEPVDFTRRNTAQLWVFDIVLSPDGWEHPQYTSLANIRLSPTELHEFVRFVEDFMRECKTQADLTKYARKYGRKIDPVTVEIGYELQLLRCLVTISGYAVRFEPFRKDDA